MDRYYKIAKCMDIWMSLREHGENINQYFKLRNIQKIGIYGYGLLGKHLVWEIENSNNTAHVEWILDKRADAISIAKYAVYKPEQIQVISKPDIIVVSAINDFEEIEAMLSSAVRVPVQSLETIIKDCINRMQRREQV